jgi:Protein kinase domain
VAPDLTRWPGADDILDAALALPEAERAAYVRTHVSDSATREAIEAVLHEAAAADDFLQPAGAWSGALGSELQRTMDDPPPALLPGSVLEHYEVVGAIGRGGMGEVYRARDTRLGRDVALKVLPTRYVQDAERQTRFKREARVLASLNHPGIAAIYGVAEGHGIEALVLELVEGPTLAELIHKGPLPLEDAVSIMRQLIDALADAHARGILHRDLKPANIKIATPASTKILDFGLARVLASTPAEQATDDATRHSSQVLIGTASYMSPEQARGRAVDQRSDIWAFGCIVFEMLTGRRAFAGQLCRRRPGGGHRTRASVHTASSDNAGLSAAAPAAMPREGSRASPCLHPGCAPGAVRRGCRAASRHVRSDGPVSLADRGPERTAGTDDDRGSAWLACPAATSGSRHDLAPGDAPARRRRASAGLPADGGLVA